MPRAPRGRRTGSVGPGRSGRKDSDPTHVAVDRDRAVRVPEGVVLHRVSSLDDKVRWNLSPPRVRVEEAMLDLAATASDDFAAIAVMADAIQARRTTADRIIEALALHRRIPRRAFLHGVLLDVRDGACSALEHAYLTRVERPHGLPIANRQVRDSTNGPVSATCCMPTSTSSSSSTDGSSTTTRRPATWISTGTWTQPQPVSRRFDWAGVRLCADPASRRTGSPRSCSDAAGPATRSPAPTANAVIRSHQVTANHRAPRSRGLSRRGGPAPRPRPTGRASRRPARA